MANYEDYYRSQGLVPNAEGTEWVKPFIPDQQPIPAPPIPLDGSPADRAAYSTARAVRHSFKLPVRDDRGSIGIGPLNPEAPSYLMEPDLQESQGGVHLPTNMYADDAGQVYFNDTNKQVPIVRRPGLLPIANSPEGLKLVMPKSLDLLGNVMGNVGGKVTAKSGEMVLGSGIVKPTIEAVKGPFYSQLERTVENAKINLATPEQWLGYLKNQPGVKAEEINTVLKEMPTEGMISKEQLSEIVKQNKVELKEKVLGGDKLEHKIKRNDEDGLWDILDNRGNVIDSGYQNERAANREVLRLAGHEQSINGTAELNRGTQYHQYQLPGGENYKETLLSLPAAKEQIKNYQEIVKIDKRLKEITELPFKQTDANTPGGKLLQKEFDELKKKRWELDEIGAKFVDNTYKAPHFNEHGTNLVGHVRTNERALGEGYVVRNKESGNTSQVFNTKDEVQKYYDNLSEGMKRNAKLEIVGSNKLKGTHIEELQSDWAQNIRDKGFKGEKEKLEPEFSRIEEKLMATNNDKMLGLPTVKQVLEKAVEDGVMTKAEANTYKRYTDIENSTPAPDMPFKKNWDEVLIKRVIRDAVDKGHKFISVTPGEAQALRYQNEIRQKVNTIDWHNKLLDADGKSKTSPTGNKQVLIDAANGEMSLTVDKNGLIVGGHKELKGKTLDEAIGKDIARQILEKPEGNIDAKGYVMGAEGMKGYYDKMVVDKFNSITKKYNTKMIPNGEHLPLHPEVLKIQRRQLLDETPPDELALKKYGKEWDELVADKKQIEADKDKGSTIYKQAGRARIHEIENQLTELHNKSVAETVERILAKEKGQPIHIMRITPELEKKAKDGFELFSTTNPTLIPVDNDPFERKYNHHSHAKWRDKK